MAEEFGVMPESPVDRAVDLARWYRQFAPSGVVAGGPAMDAPTDVGDQLAPEADGTNLVTLHTGYALVGGYWYRNTSRLQLPVAPNTSSQTRWDRLVIRANPNAGTVAATLIPGTPGSGTLPPIVRQGDGVQDIPVARYPVPGNSATVDRSTLVPEREFTTPFGAVPNLDGVKHTGLGVGGLTWENRRLVVRDTDGADRVVADTRYPTPWEPLNLVSTVERYPTSGFAPETRLLSPTRAELRGVISRKDGNSFGNGAIVARVPASMRPNAYVRHVASSEQTSGGNTVRLEIASVNSTAYGPGQILVYHLHSPGWIAFDGWVYDFV